MTGGLDPLEDVIALGLLEHIGVSSTVGISLTLTLPSLSLVGGPNNDHGDGGVLEAPFADTTREKAGDAM